MDVSASFHTVVTGDNVGNVVLLSTSGEEVCMAPCSISSTGIFMAHVLSYSTGTWKKEQVTCSSGDEFTHCLGGEKSSISATQLTFYIVECNGNNF